MLSFFYISIGKMENEASWAIEGGDGVAQGEKREKRERQTRRGKY